MPRKQRGLDVTMELRRLMHAAPFVPFRIKTTDGDTFTIMHPDFLMISPRGTTALFYPKEEEGHHVLNLRQIVSMEQIRNGSKRPGRR
jgi:hypothetical protein